MRVIDKDNVFKSMINHRQQLNKNTTFEDFINNIDFKLLKKQKDYLLDENEKFEGLINLLDIIQDLAVDKFGFNENEVFNL